MRCTTRCDPWQSATAADHGSSPTLTTDHLAQRHRSARRCADGELPAGLREGLSRFKDFLFRSTRRARDLAGRSLSMKRACECCADHGGTPEASGAQALRLIQRQDARRPFAAQSRRRNAGVLPRRGARCSGGEQRGPRTRIRGRCRRDLRPAGRQRLAFRCPCSFIDARRSELRQRINLPFTGRPLAQSLPCHAAVHQSPREGCGSSAGIWFCWRAIRQSRSSADRDHFRARSPGPARSWWSGHGGFVVAFDELDALGSGIVIP